MDPHEATKTVFSRIQNLDPGNAYKIMGILLIQDHGEKEMVKLAFGPESLLQSVVLKARQELGISPNTPSTPSRQNSASSPSNPSGPFIPNSLNIPSTLSVSSLASLNIPFSDELISPSSSSANYFPTTGVIDEVQLQEQLSFLSDPQQDLSSLSSPGGGATWGGTGGVAL